MDYGRRSIAFCLAPYSYLPPEDTHVGNGPTPPKGTKSIVPTSSAINEFTRILRNVFCSPQISQEYSSLGAKLRGKRSAAVKEQVWTGLRFENLADGQR
jgi:hypothetical protein